MASHQDADATPVIRRGVWVSRVFWLASCADVLLFLASLFNVWTYPGGQFDGLVVLVLLVFLGVMGLTMGVVALIRRPAAYGAALALIAVPMLLLGIKFFSVTG